MLDMEAEVRAQQAYMKLRDLQVDEFGLLPVYLDGQKIDDIPVEMYPTPRLLQERIEESYRHAAFRGQTAAQQILAGQIKSGHQALLESSVPHYEMQSAAGRSDHFRRHKADLMPREVYDAQTEYFASKPTIPIPKINTAYPAMFCASPPDECIRNHQHPPVKNKTLTPKQVFLNQYSASAQQHSPSWPAKEQPLVQELKAGPCDICDWHTDDLRGYYMPESETLWVCVRCKKDLTFQPPEVVKRNWFYRFVDWDSSPMVTAGVVAVVIFLFFILTS